MKEISPQSDECERNMFRKICLKKKKQMKVLLEISLKHDKLGKVVQTTSGLQISKAGKCVKILCFICTIVCSFPSKAYQKLKASYCAVKIMANYQPDSHHSCIQHQRKSLIPL